MRLTRPTVKIEEDWIDLVLISMMQCQCFMILSYYVGGQWSIAYRTIAHHTTIQHDESEE